MILDHSAFHVTEVSDAALVRMGMLRYFQLSHSPDAWLWKHPSGEPDCARTGDLRSVIWSTVSGSHDRETPQFRNNGP